MKTFKIGGIHPDPRKITADIPVQSIQLPSMLNVMLNQSIGKPAKPVVKQGDIVAEGQLIAEADGVVSANIHAPRAGKISKITKARNQQGYWFDAIAIECDTEAVRPAYDPRPDVEVQALSAEEIVQAIKDAGIVGLGGAAFPTAVKLTPPPGLSLDILIINGAECEPYLTCDDRLMREKPVEILKGTALLMKAINVNRCMIGIENNKPEAIKTMTRAAENFSNIEIVPLRTKYPQGGEKQLITAMTGREVPSGKIPANVGALVDNVATAFAVYEAIYCGKPLIERIVTVTGKSIASPGNYLVPVGTDIDTLLTVGGVDAGRQDVEIIAGGPMMGRDVSMTEGATVKATSGITILTGKEIRRPHENPCIRCGRCLHACPMGLEPYLLYAQARKRMWQEMKDNSVMDCIECGSCSWSCPADKPLLDFIKLGKIEIRKQKL